MLRWRLTMVVTAMTWSGSVAWRMPRKKPSAMTESRVIIEGSVHEDFGFFNGDGAPIRGSTEKLFHAVRICRCKSSHYDRKGVGKNIAHTDWNRRRRACGINVGAIARSSGN